MHFEFAYFYFVLIYLELKRQLLSYISVVSSKTTPDSRTKWATKVYTRFQTKKGQKS